jgi:TPR repeat protein
VNAPVPADSDAWRVAALTMMSPQELADILGNDPRSALPWIEAAARLGIVEAQIRLGRMLLAGEGVAVDEAAAFSWFARAAETGVADAQNMLGRCHEHGWGTKADPAYAVTWYARAAHAGDAWAQYNLGHLLLDGNGVARDAYEACRWYRRAADQGHPRAMNLVGRCCEEGWGTEKNSDEAREWYRRSAEGGYFRGCFNYASVLAADGRGEDAAIWCDRALALAPEKNRDALIVAWQRAERDRSAAPRVPLQTTEAHA